MPDAPKARARARMTTGGRAPLMSSAIDRIVEHTVANGRAYFRVIWRSKKQDSWLTFKTIRALDIFRAYCKSNNIIARTASIRTIKPAAEPTELLEFKEAEAEPEEEKAEEEPEPEEEEEQSKCPHFPPHTCYVDIDSDDSVTRVRLSGVKVRLFRSISLYLPSHPSSLSLSLSRSTAPSTTCSCERVGRGSVFGVTRRKRRRR